MIPEITKIAEIVEVWDRDGIQTGIEQYHPHMPPPRRPKVQSTESPHEDTKQPPSTPPPSGPPVCEPPLGGPPWDTPSPSSAHSSSDHPPPPTPAASPQAAPAAARAKPPATSAVPNPTMVWQRVQDVHGYQEVLQFHTWGTS